MLHVESTCTLSYNNTVEYLNLNGLRITLSFVDNVLNNMIQATLSVEQASARAIHRITSYMLEGTYILVGTWDIPLHTWYALSSETASVTLRPEGYSRPREQESQPCLSVEWSTCALCAYTRTFLYSSPLWCSAHTLIQLFCHHLKYSFKCTLKTNLLTKIQQSKKIYCTIGFVTKDFPSVIMFR